MSARRENYRPTASLIFKLVRRKYPFLSETSAKEINRKKSISPWRCGGKPFLLELEQYLAFGRYCPALSFNYRNLTETSPVSILKMKTKPPVRSLSSNNSNFSYHLHQLRNLGKRKVKTGESERNPDEQRIHSTFANLKVECDEQGTGPSTHTTMQLQTGETSIELPVTWKPAVQRISIQRDSWDHKVEFLLAIIGYGVDLGRIRFWWVLAEKKQRVPF